MGHRIVRVDGVLVTKAQFFARVVHAAFRELAFTIDADASLIEATRCALRNGKSIHCAHRDAAALSEFHKGGVRINEHEALKSKYTHLSEIENLLFEKQLIGQDTAQLIALEWLRDRHTLPQGFSDTEVCFDGIFDFSECELETLYRLAELGLSLRFILPIDQEPRGLLLPIQDLLSQLEARGGSLPISVETPQLKVSQALTPFMRALFVDDAEDLSGVVQSVLTNRFDSQVDWVCDEISRLLAKEPRASIAIAFRSFDSRFRRFEEALCRRRIPFKIDMRLPLKDLPEMKTLMRKLMAGLDEERVLPLSLHIDECVAFLGDLPAAGLLTSLKERFCDEERGISNLNFFHWLSVLLERRWVGSRAPRVADAVELVFVKQLWSRTYDFVFLPDLAQGRFPKTDNLSVLSDEERFEVNRLLKKRVFGFVSENPLEASTVPIKQAFETLWFSFAIRSADKGLFLSSSNLDPKGREQAQSEFLSAALRVVGVRTITKSAVLSSQRRPRSSAGMTRQMDGSLTRKVFSRWLGLDGQHPLTATRLEAFALCPFRALVQRIFGIDDQKGSDVEVDARAIGRFVHAVLECYFREGHDSRQSLEAIVESKKELLSSEGTQVSPLIIEAQLLWLTLILERAISNMIKEPPDEGAKPRLFEHAVGFGQPHHMVIGETKISLGGIIDRVDIGEETVAVVDYKMSTISALRQKTSERTLLETHFQMPLYIRILLEKYPELRGKDICAYLISIRDGSTLRLKGDLKDRAMDDERSDGLYAAISRVMTPILDGEFQAKRNESCPSCYLKQVCRL